MPDNKFLVSTSIITKKLIKAYKLLSIDNSQPYPQRKYNQRCYTITNIGNLIFITDCVQMNAPIGLRL